MKHRISAAATDGDNGMRFLSPTYGTLASGNTRGPQMRLSRPLRHGDAQHLVCQCGRSTKYIAPQRSLRLVGGRPVRDGNAKNEAECVLDKQRACAMCYLYATLTQQRAVYYADAPGRR